MKSYDPERWMWAEACDYIERAEKLHRQFFQIGQSPARRLMWEPPVDIFETRTRVWIIVALPGVDSEHITITIEPGAIVVTGTHPLSIASDAVIHRLEIPHGHFERRIELPAGHLKIEHKEISNGCLRLSLVKQ